MHTRYLYLPPVIVGGAVDDMFNFPVVMIYVYVCVYISYSHAYAVFFWWVDILDFELGRTACFSQ